LLQHYGLYSPVLDLTNDPSVALFFATHKYSGRGAQSRYDFNGTNGRRSIVYAIWQDATESLLYERRPMLESLDPQRPKRQACVVMPSNAYAMNLAGDFIVAAIQLEFDLTEPGPLRAEYLFPGEMEDPMLAAFKRGLKGVPREAITEFG